jgi:hypothetical protein
MVVLLVQGLNLGLGFAYQGLGFEMKGFKFNISGKVIKFSSILC